MLKDHFVLLKEWMLYLDCGSQTVSIIHILIDNVFDNGIIVCQLLQEFNKLQDSAIGKIVCNESMYLLTDKYRSLTEKFWTSNVNNLLLDVFIFFHFDFTETHYESIHCN